MNTTNTYKVIGTRPIRHDGVDKVTGRAIYGADVQMAGLLHGRILRSPIPHGHIRSLDASKALALPGVEAVVTCADLTDPGDRIAELGEGAVNLKHLSSNCLARGKVHYKGQAVAAIAAVSAHVAEEALKLIAVEYERLPHVTDVRAAMQDGAPLLHDDLVTQSLGQPTGKHSNIAKHIQFKKGDVEQGFKQAAVVVEREFHTATVHQGYIEPHNATALWSADGTVTIWCSTQGAFTVRAQIAELLAIPLSRIKVVPTEIGGGFGGKIRVYLEPVAAALSKKTGKPVKITMNRADVFEATGPTPGSYIKVKMGADKDGKLVAAQAYLAYEAGAFPGSPLGPGAMCIFACYDLANVHIDGSVSLVEGSTDIGGSRTSIAMQLAEALGIRAEDVRPVVGDTDAVGYSDVTGGSRVTFATGWAAYEAGQDIKRQMIARAALLWGVPQEAVAYEDGTLRCLSDDKKRLTVKAL